MVSLDLRRLAAQVAPKLAGREVILSWTRPHPPHEKGQALLFMGEAIVRINPYLSDTEAYLVLLHELAHIRSWHVDKRYRLKSIQEAEANNLAGEWERLAQEARPYGDTLRKLRFLLDAAHSGAL